MRSGAPHELRSGARVQGVDVNRLRMPALTAPPRALLALLAVAVISAVAWSLAVAPLQQPDEPNHMARIQRMAEGGKLDSTPSRDWSSDQAAGAGAVNTLGLPGYPTIKPSWDPQADKAYRKVADAVTAKQRRDADAPTGADTNPPAYYVWGAVFYHLGGDFLTRVWVLRLLGAVWLAVTVLGAWLLIGELAARQRVLQVAGAGFVALQPILGSISSAVSPDGMVIALSTLALWLMVRTARRPPSAANVVGLVVALALAGATKSQALALVPAGLVALLITFGRHTDARRFTRGRFGLLPAVLAGAVAVVALVALLLVAAPRIAPQLSLGELPSPRRFGAYLWEYYLPRPSFLQPIPNLGDPRFTVTWIRQGWGLFGPLDASLPEVFFTLIKVGGWIVVAAAAAAVLLKRRSIDRGAAVVLGLAALLTWLGLHFTEYKLLISYASGPILQGRYLLLLVGVGALVVAAAVSLVPRPARLPVTAVLLGSLFVVQAAGLDAALARYFAY